MQRTVQLTLAVLGVSLLALTGCAGSDRPVQPTDATRSIAVEIPPAHAPLAPCVDPTHTRPKPLDTAIAWHLFGGRSGTAFALDVGSLRAATAPRGARPVISAAPAFCNLLAGATPRTTA